MRIEDPRPPLGSIVVRKPHPEQPVREQTEITPARTRHIAAEQAGGREWNLPELPAFRLERRARGHRIAVEIVTHGIDAGAIEVPLFLQYAERPPVPSTD